MEEEKGKKKKEEKEEQEEEKEDTFKYTHLSLESHIIVFNATFCQDSKIHV